MKQKVTFAQLSAIIKQYVDPKKQGSTTFEITRDNIANLIDKVGKIVTLDGSFQDKLFDLNGDDLPLGKTIEEYYQDLILPADYDSTGADALAPSYPSYRPVCYSYTLGRKVLSTSIKYDEYERAMNTPSEYDTLMSIQYKRLEDSENLFRYGLKKQLLGNLVDKAIETTNPSKQYSSTTAYESGEFVKKDSSATKVGVIMNKLSSSEHGNWDSAVKNGDIVELDLVSKIAKPIDTNTGEAFIKQVKSDIETAQFINEGHSFNGNTIGAENGLFLFVKKGVIPALEVETYAGAFNKDDLMMPADLRIVDDFGESDPDTYAILMDKRGVKLHNDYRATRENLNGRGDFLNLFRHTENTGFISRNTFVKVYKAQ